MDELPPFPPQKHLDLHTSQLFPPMQTIVCVCVYAMLLFYVYVYAGVFMILYLSAGCNDTARC